MPKPVCPYCGGSGKQPESPPLPAFIPKDSWDEYLAHRNRKRAPMTREIAIRLWGRIEALKNMGYDPRAVLIEAIHRNWIDIKVEWIQKSGIARTSQVPSKGHIAVPVERRPEPTLTPEQRAEKLRRFREVINGIGKDME